jgi:homoserine O-acetyltransferase
MPARHATLARWQIDATHHTAALGDLPLESGKRIEMFEQSYVTHGTLDAQRRNAVLICSAITGNHHRLDYLIGPGKALDPARWFIIACDAIGNGLSTSPSNSQRQPKMQFPAFSIRDMVAAQHALITRRLGIERLAVVIGASMGGMQALQWAVSHPRMMDKIVALTPMARTSAWSLVVNETTRACLMADPAWNGHEFTAIPVRGWKAWVNVQRVLASRTPEAIAHDFGNPQDVLAWTAALREQWLADGFDANDFLYQSRAYDAHDVGSTPGFDGDTKRALASIEAPVLVLAPPLDLYNPAAEARAAASAIPGARYVEIPSRQGHQSASATAEDDVRFLNQVIGDFVATDPAHRMSR